MLFNITNDIKYFFSDEEKRADLKRVMDEWLNTPFRHKTCVKGLGCDCVHFVGGVMEELHLCVVKRLKIPNYPRDWHLHNTRELLLEGIEAAFDVVAISLDGNLMDGDLILSHYGKASSHIGVYFGGYVYQAVDGIGVNRINFNDRKFRSQMKFVRRLIVKVEL